MSTRRRPSVARTDRARHRPSGTAVAASNPVRSGNGPRWRCRPGRPATGQYRPGTQPRSVPSGVAPATVRRGRAPVSRRQRPRLSAARPTATSRWFDARVAEALPPVRTTPWTEMEYRCLCLPMPPRCRPASLAGPGAGTVAGHPARAPTNGPHGRPPSRFPALPRFGASGRGSFVAPRLGRRRARRGPGPASGARSSRVAGVPARAPVVRCRAGRAMYRRSLQAWPLATTAAPEDPSARRSSPRTPWTQQQSVGRVSATLRTPSPTDPAARGTRATVGCVRSRGAARAPRRTGSQSSRCSGGRHRGGARLTDVRPRCPPAARTRRRAGRCPGAHRRVPSSPVSQSRGPPPRRATAVVPGRPSATRSWLLGLIRR